MAILCVQPACSNKIKEVLMELVGIFMKYKRKYIKSIKKKSCSH